MKQYDIAVTPLLLNALQDNIGARPRPILRVDVLQNDEVTQVLRDLQGNQLADLGWTCVGSIGRAKQCRRTTTNRFDEQLGRLQFQPDVLRPAESKSGVIVGVISN